MDFLLNIIGDINEQTAGLTSSVDAVQNWMWSNFLYYALIAAGLYITIRTRGVQWRSIKEMVRVLGDPVAREADGKKSISSFRAFTVSAASRVGTGTVAGVADTDGTGVEAGVKSPAQGIKPRTGHSK